ncbi:hypothetical protein [Aeromonas sp. MR16]|uniref:hypothetical protein n=1 Tax=Aeromonas sp. MR16 TaxID=2923420 RepID=UPI001F4B27F8|nr:hypothetical protein [Aeromonas sp. MR16]MCH7372860.1 hypothetical protein [Aeromonas sp. MR16]
MDKGTYTIDEVEHGGAPDVLSLPAHGGDAHRRVCATETVLFRSHLRAAPIKFFAKVDYRKAIGPERAR